MQIQIQNQNQNLLHKPAKPGTSTRKPSLRNQIPISNYFSINPRSSQEAQQSKLRLFNKVKMSSKQSRSLTNQPSNLPNLSKPEARCSSDITRKDVPPGTGGGHVSNQENKTGGNGRICTSEQE